MARVELSTVAEQRERALRPILIPLQPLQAMDPVLDWNFPQVQRPEFCLVIYATLRENRELLSSAQ